MTIKSLLYNRQWGNKSFGALILSVISGVVVSLQYNPAEPFYSTNAIDLLTPFGAFWRSLHFYSSQLFFLFSVIHFLTILDHGLSSRVKKNWMQLVFSLAVIILLLFTGYVLRGDATGEMAGHIAENIALSIPLIGKSVNAVLFSISTQGMLRIYANHLVGLGMLWLVLSWDHIRKFIVDWREQGFSVMGTILFCVIINAPKDIPVPGKVYISGPWFFLGLQELLRYIQPFWAGVVFPSAFIFSLILLQTRKWRRGAIWFCLVWLAAYALLSVVAAIRSY